MTKDVMEAAKKLVDSVEFDCNGMNGKGGNGGLVSDPTIKAAGALRIALSRATTPSPVDREASREDDVPCPCTLIEQDEDCPIGYPSMICGVCKGIGNTTLEHVTALACEMIKIASDMSEPEDPFAAWESISLVQSQRDGLLEEARDVLASASDTYKKRNGHRGSFEDDGGEKCWIVPFDAFEGLRRAVDALTTTAGSENA
jgi:hypothetical protein